MAKINLLPKSVSELIAAGEVVERPASVVKETVENSIDAGASHITVEIKNGGITFIRITDDGCGIAAEDVPTAFLRHATSKIKSADDLSGISTLGFRGEALAAVSTVSRTEIITKTAPEESGTHYIIEGGAEVLNEEVGCPCGTTLIVRNLFYNTPARMKFLKKDSTEGTAVGAVAERMALSHPEIAFKFIRDEKQVFATSGDGKLLNCIYSVLGREYHSALIEVKGETDGISVSGYTCKPVFCRASRGGQYIFLNGRLVLSKTVMAAAEQAYRDSSMIGKYPAFVLFVNAPAESVDVNVHPAKTEVKFSDEKRIFSAVYYAVKSAVAERDTRPEMPIKKPNDTFFKMTADEYRQTAVKFESEKPKPTINATFKEDNRPFFMREEVIKAAEPKPVTLKEEIKEEKQEPKEYNPEEEVLLIGEAFSTYIIVKMGKSLYLIDKHAAHERMIYNRLKATETPSAQNLLTPVTVHLSAEEHEAAVRYEDLLFKAGFETEDFGGSDILVRAVPAALDKKDIGDCIREAVSTLIDGTEVNTKALDNIYHTVACKAAVKAGYITSREEMLNLAKAVLEDRDVMYCPHGRPVAYEIKKSALDKYFGRIQ